MLDRTPICRLGSFRRLKNIDTLPWLSSGAYLSPPDIYVSPQLRRRLKGKDLATREKLMAGVSKALGDKKADRGVAVA